MLTGAGPDGVIADVIGDAAAAAGGQLDVPAIAGLVADLDAVFDDTHPDPTRRYSAAFYQGAPASEPDLAGQLDESTRMTYGLKANEPAFRDIAQGLYMLSAVDFGDPIMTEDAYREFAGAAVQRLQRGLAELVDLAARTGQNQARVSDNQGRLDAAADLYSRQIVELEKRDPYEAATLLTSLEAQLETSFAITARMNQLSLVNYLS
ncbi:MAG: flagellin [Geminicoccaceae bacterium]